MNEQTVEAIEHVEATGHSVDWNEDCDVWACFDCSWIDSNFVPITALGGGSDG